MSDDAEVVAPKKRRGRPPTKKRHDPEAAPVNGDYQNDVIFDREPGKRYAFLSADDIPKFRHRGYVPTERRVGGPRPAWDMGSATDSGYTVVGLVQYEVDEERIQRFDNQALKQSEMRMKAIHAAAKATGGYMTHQMERV
jgi:hypothetical protein